MQSIGLVARVLVAGLATCASALADPCADFDPTNPAKSGARIFLPCIAENVKEIAKLRAQIQKLEKVDRPLDEYMLKTFLMEIVQGKGQNSQYGNMIAEELHRGNIKAAFQIFSDSIEEEINMLSQIKIGYQRPTTTQLGSDNFQTFDPKSAYATNFGVLIARGQTLEVIATLLKYNPKPLTDNPDTPVDPDPGFPPVDMAVQCLGCKKWEIPMPTSRTASDFGRRDLTEEVDWESAVNGLKFVEFKVVPKPPPGVDYTFAAKFVVVVSNPIPKTKTSR